MEGCTGTMPRRWHSFQALKVVVSGLGWDPIWPGKLAGVCADRFASSFAFRVRSPTCCVLTAAFGTAATYEQPDVCMPAPLSELDAGSST